MAAERVEPTTLPSDRERTEELLDLLEGLVAELYPKRRTEVTLESRLDKDLGLDSLARVELMQRLERRFGVELPDELLASAETPADLLAGIAAARDESESGEVALTGRGGPRGRAERAPDSTATLMEVLEWHADSHPDRPYLELLEGESSRHLTYAGLLGRARAVAGGLVGLGLEPGARVALMLPTGLDFFFAFWGILMAGGVPVPLYPPVRPSQIEDHLRRQAGILRNCGSVLLVTDSEVKPVARILRTHVPTLNRVATVTELAGPPPSALPVRRGEDLAFLQYTSGSTGQPKGVMLTHANLLANLRVMGRTAEVSSDDLIVSWLPLYHDMGLIGATLASLYFAFPLVLTSPLAFLSRPRRWLWTIHRRRATISAAPNFAYELCLSKVADDELEGLDLSTWRIAMNGAEPVSPSTVERFAARFAPYGLRREALMPVYGLAECSLGLAFPPLGRGPVIDWVERRALAAAGRAEPAAAEDPEAVAFVGAGYPLEGHEVRIVDPSGGELPERRQGRLEFRGPSATAGYFDNPEATTRLRDGKWLDSGDLAYLADGEVFLTGRAKDLVIRAGRNIYPHEVEEAVGEVPGVRKGCVAAFGVTDEEAGTERLVVLAETRETEPEARRALEQAIDERVVELLGEPADQVVLAPPRTVLKTSSGKIRREASKQLYEAGQVGRRAPGVAWQLGRLLLSGALPQLRRGLAAVGELLYSGYAWLVLGAVAPLAWTSVVVAPGLARRRRLARSFARLYLSLTGVPLEVSGKEKLAAGPVVVAVNHSSYADGIVLTAALPPDFAYVAKRELAGHPVTGYPLHRLGAFFVERWDHRRGAGDSRRVVEAVRAGTSVVVFPEGTFRRAPGLLPFRLGAFQAAAEAGVPVVAVGLKGSRDLLRGEQWRLRRVPLSVEVAEPVVAAGGEWEEVIALRDTVREQLLALTGEPEVVEQGLPERKKRRGRRR